MSESNKIENTENHPKHDSQAKPVAPGSDIGTRQSASSKAPDTPGWDSNWQTLGNQEGRLSISEGMSSSISRTRQQKAAQLGMRDLRISQYGEVVIQSLMTLVKRLRMYEDGHHAQVAQSVDTLKDAIKTAVRENHDEPVECYIRSHGFEIRSIPLYELNKRSEEFHQILWRHGIGRIQIKSKFSERELISLAEVILSDPGGQKRQIGEFEEVDKTFAFKYFSEKLTALKVGNIQVFEQVRETVSQEKADLMTQAGRRLFADCKYPGAERYHCLLQWAYDLQVAIYHQRPVDLRKLLPLCRDIIQELRVDPRGIIPYALMRGVGAPEISVPVNSALLAVSALAPLVESDSELLEWLRASFFIDVGTYADKSRLDLEDTYVQQEQWHPLVSSSVLDGLPRLSRLAMVVAFEHHLGEGQQGFPVQPFKWPRNIYSSVLDIAVRYTELTTFRRLEYGKVPEILTHDQAIEHLKAMAHQEMGETERVIDIVALNAIIHTLGDYPAGSLVRLATGQIGLVLHELDIAGEADSDDNEKTPQEPILLLTDPDGKRLSNPELTRHRELSRRGVLEIVSVLPIHEYPFSVLQLIASDWNLNTVKPPAYDQDATFDSSKDQPSKPKSKTRRKSGHSFLDEIEL